jgi:ubiquinone/menaquinone biosynthesis C-methylase UbiE
MLTEARRAHPDIPFEEGRLDDLPITTESLSGAVCWYSIIHTPPERLVDTLTELKRVLEPGGHLLLAFQAGLSEPVHRADAHESTMRASVIARRRLPVSVDGEPLDRALGCDRVLIRPTVPSRR